MNKAERGIYLILAEEIDTVLCSFCKYSKCESGDSPCECGEPYCVHPLRYNFGHEYDFEPGVDCWGFRAQHDVSFCADITGFVLQNGWNDWVLWKSKKGIWRIWGSKEVLV